MQLLLMQLVMYSMPPLDPEPNYILWHSLETLSSLSVIRHPLQSNMASQEILPPLASKCLQLRALQGEWLQEMGKTLMQPRSIPIAELDLTPLAKQDHSKKE